MRFGHPEMFWLIAVLLLLIAAVIYNFKNRRKLIQKFADAETASRLSNNVSKDKKIFRFLFLFISIIFFILAAAAPQWGKELQELSRRGIDIMIALDTSKSMLAQDIQPSRLAKAKGEVDGFMDRLKGDRVGLIFFAGISFVQCPLTLDYSAMSMFLEIADPDILPVPGTDIAGAIEKAIEAFKGSGKRTKVLILITDGETHTPGTEETIEKAIRENIIIYTVGIGWTSGVPIPVKNERGEVISYKRTEEGNPVLSSLNKNLLQEIADKTGGKFYIASSTESELDKIADEIDEMEKLLFKGKKGIKYKDRYQYPLVLALVFFMAYTLISDRKKGF